MLVGRDRELAAIVAILDSARAGRSAALCLVGDAGIGKSTLLQAAHSAGGDFLRLETVGIESELGLSHAGLGDVLTEITGYLGELPLQQREAVETALGLATTRTGHPDPYLVALGTMTLLAAAAVHQPVLVMIDDAQWVDGESRRAIAFAARRLQHDQVAFVFAERSGGDLRELAGMTHLLISGLDTRECQMLLGPGVSGTVVERLTGVTGGNPLALTELARQLTAAQRRGSAILPPVLSLGERLTRDCELSLRKLSAPGRQALLLAAVSTDGQAGPIGTALEQTGLDPIAVIAELESVDILQLSSGGYAFRHPLFRQITIQLASPAERRRAHAALAAALSDRPALRTRHLAEAVVGFDDEVATELLDAAEDERRRNGFAAAAVLQERAGQLSAAPQRAAACQSAAAESALLSGDIAAARRLAGLALDATGNADATARALLTLGTLEQYAGSVPRSRELLEEAARLGNGVVRLRALAELANTSYRLGSAQGMAAAAAAMREHADPAVPEQQMLACYTDGAALAFGGGWQRARAPMSRALDLLEADPVLRDDPRYLSTAILAPGWMGEPNRLLGYLDRRLDRAREVGALGVLPMALSLLAGGAAYEFGWHEIAYAYAGESVEIGEELGFVTDVAFAHAVLAWELASRGHDDQAAVALARARELDARAEITGSAVHVELVDAFAALCSGDLSRVVELLEARIAADGGRFPRGDYELGVAPELVEAYLGLGRRADAVSLAGRHAALHRTSADPQIRGQAFRLLGMTADEEGPAEGFFASAHEAHAAGSNAFEAARTHLAHGAALRKRGRRIESRSHLRTAEDGFSTAGLDGWADRARAELSATGQQARRRIASGDALTSQETRVALLVARGLSNKEIAAALFLSPKTVEHHVSSALRKRRLRTRTELAVAFSHV